MTLPLHSALSLLTFEDWLATGPLRSIIKQKLKKGGLQKYLGEKNLSMKKNHLSMKKKNLSKLYHNAFFPLLG